MLLQFICQTQLQMSLPGWPSLLFFFFNSFLSFPRFCFRIFFYNINSPIVHQINLETFWFLIKKISSSLDFISTFSFTRSNLFKNSFTWLIIPLCPCVLSQHFLFQNQFYCCASNQFTNSQLNQIPPALNIVPPSLWTFFSFQRIWKS